MKKSLGCLLIYFIFSSVQYIWSNIHLENAWIALLNYNKMEFEF